MHRYGFADKVKFVEISNQIGPEREVFKLLNTAHKVDNIFFFFLKNGIFLEYH